MSKKAIYTLCYALITLAGGTMGYLMAGSLPSLVASSISGTILLVATLAILRNHTWGTYLALTMGALLTLFFSYRLGMNPAVPAFIMAITSSFYAYLMMKEVLANKPA